MSATLEGLSRSGRISWPSLTFRAVILFSATKQPVICLKLKTFFSPVTVLKDNENQQTKRLTAGCWWQPFTHALPGDFVVIVMDNLWLPGSLNSFQLSTVAASAHTRSLVLRAGTGALIQQQRVQTSTSHHRWSIQHTSPRLHLQIEIAALLIRLIDLKMSASTQEVFWA